MNTCEQCICWDSKVWSVVWSDNFVFFLSRRRDKAGQMPRALAHIKLIYFANCKTWCYCTLLKTEVWDELVDILTWILCHSLPWILGVRKTYYLTSLLGSDCWCYWIFRAARYFFRLVIYKGRDGVAVCVTCNLLIMYQWKLRSGPKMHARVYEIV